MVNRITKQGGRITKTQVEAKEPIYNVRIKPENYEPIIKIADDEGRTITAQINHIIAQYLKDKLK